jgi:GNAT superfamily N-acetyltransferase
MDDALDLCGLWFFQPDPADEGESLGYSRAEYNARFWREVRLPADFETCHPALGTYEGTGWFRCVIAVPETWRDKRVMLNFEGVNYHTVVWVNGHCVGEHLDGFLPFAFVIQEQLDFDGADVIAVRVDNIRRPGEVPGLQRGWRTFGGILREVSLVATDRLTIDHVTAVAEPVARGGVLSLDVTVKNDHAADVLARLTALVRDAEGRALAQLTTLPMPVSAGGETLFSLAGNIPGALPWSPAAPNLYTVQMTLEAEGRAVDERVFRTGFRKIEAHDGKVWLNGEPVYLTGFNRHEDSPRSNSCPDPETTRRDLEAMKEAGANFVRLCHYPHHPAELDLCDALGLLAMGEIPLYWWDGLAEGEAACAAKLDAAKRQVQAMIRRDGNHPALIFWSVSNETHDQRPEVAAGNRALVRLAKELDPTRLAVHVSDHWQSAPNFDADDVICVNGYPSIHGRYELADPAYDFVQSTAFWRDGLAALHARYLDKPILVTEFGYTSFQHVTDNAFGEDVHADVIAHEFAGMDAPYVCGATVWCWADHPWPPATFAFCRHLGASPYGVLTRDRRRRKPYWTARRLFREKQAMPEPPRPTTPHLGPAGYEVFMIRPHLRDIPQVPFPEGFGIRAMRTDEGALWTDIERDAEPHFPVGADVFHNEFGNYLQTTQWRSFIVTNAKGAGVGVVSAWFARDFKGEDYGMIHWIAIRQAYQGLGLGKAALSFALNQLSQWHERAFLGTQTKRLPAIKMYLDFGFVPDLDPPGALEVWREVATKVHHPALEKALSKDE